MTIPFGRRRLIVRWDAARTSTLDLPAAYDATEAELLRLSQLKTAADGLGRWQAYSVLPTSHPFLSKID